MYVCSDLISHHAMSALNSQKTCHQRLTHHHATTAGNWVDRSTRQHCKKIRKFSMHMVVVNCFHFPIKYFQKTELSFKF